MKKNITLLLGGMLLVASPLASATTDTKSIEVQVTQGTYVSLIGSSVDGNSKTLTMDSVKGNNATSLGTLGVDSNGSNCNISFSTLNNYTLKHETSGATLKRFYLTYLSKKISSNSDAYKDMTVTCSEAASQLTITPTGATPETIEPGTYKDTITVVLTAE